MREHSTNQLTTLLQDTLPELYEHRTPSAVTLRLLQYLPVTLNSAIITGDTAAAPVSP